MVVFATFNAVPVVLAMVLLAPVTLMVPPPVALNPVPLVVEMANAPPVKLIVHPVLAMDVTAVLAPVVRL